MLLDAIRTQFDALSKSERKVATAVLDNPELTISGKHHRAGAQRAGVGADRGALLPRHRLQQLAQEFKLQAGAGPGAGAQPARDGDAVAGRPCRRPHCQDLQPLGQCAARPAQQPGRTGHTARHRHPGTGHQDRDLRPAAVPAWWRPTPSTSSLVPACQPWPTSTRTPTPFRRRCWKRRRRGGCHFTSAAAASRCCTACSWPAAPAPTSLPLRRPARRWRRWQPYWCRLIGPWTTDPYRPITARLAHLVVIDILAVGLALRRGPGPGARCRPRKRRCSAFDIRFDPLLETPERR